MFTRWLGFVLGVLVGAAAGTALLWRTWLVPELNRARDRVVALGNGSPVASSSGKEASRPGLDASTVDGPFALGRFESELRQCLKLEKPAARHQAVGSGAPGG